MLETVFNILKQKRTPLGDYKLDFIVKEAFTFLKARYIDEKEKKIAA